MPNSISVPTPVGPFQIKGKHMVIAFAAGVIVGAVVLYKAQKKLPFLLPTQK